MASTRRVIEGFSTDRVTTEELQHKLVTRLRSDSYEPPKLPSVALQLMSLSRNPEATLAEVVDLLQQDQLLTGQVIKLANAVAFRGSTRISSLRDAVVRLGISNLRNLVLRVAMDMRVFRSQGYSEIMDALRRHSLATAHVARVLANGHEWAFLAGLLHDVGIAGCLLVLGDTPRAAERPDVTKVWPAIEAVHERASTRMVELWGVPADIVEAIKDHHHVEGSFKQSRLRATICLADAIASECGYRVRPKAPNHPLQTRHRVDSTAPETLVSAREALQIDDDMYHLVVKRVTGELSQMIEDGSPPG